MKMTKEAIVLAVLSTSGAPRIQYTPVQLQKMFFLVDKLGQKIGGPYFDFQPYDYGPFDKEVYEVLDSIIIKELAEKNRGEKGWNNYFLTEQGFEEGNKVLQQLPKPLQEYIAELSKFVRSLSFVELVSSIYKAYPDMKVNSVFKD
jgi:uncharacterized protein